MKRKKIRHGYEFKLMRKTKGAHLKRPQVHFGNTFDCDNYQSLSDTDVVEIRDWLSRYINEFIKQTPALEATKFSRICANRIIKNLNRIEAELND